MKNYELISFASAEALAAAAAEQWLDAIATAARMGRAHHVALSGGRITQKFFTEVVNRAKVLRIGDGGAPTLPSNVHFFWADERCVPPADPESNFRLAQERLFGPLAIADRQIHRVHGEKPPATAAQWAEREIRQVTAEGGAPGLDQPVLDLIFLGLGEDGHVASLFPRESEAAASDPAVYRAIGDSPKPPPNRVTLGYPAIAAAREVWMLASGSGKETAFRESLSPDGKTPFARVLRLRRHTRILTDISA